MVWGHEHECRLKDERHLELKKNPTREFYIMQPGENFQSLRIYAEQK